MNQKNQKGITLIALVITIIVLLILAGVTLSMVLGDDGIIAQAQQAKEVQEQKAGEEQNTIKNSSGEIDKYAEGTAANLAEKGELKIGDYIQYTYTPGEASITAKEAGISEDRTYSDDQSLTINYGTQTFSSDEDENEQVTNWRVLSTSNGIVKLISEQPISSVQLAGGEAYLNGPDILNNICKNLYSGDFGTGRSINMKDIDESYSYDGRIVYQNTADAYVRFKPETPMTVEQLEAKENVTITNRQTPNGANLGKMIYNGYQYNPEEPAQVNSTIYEKQRILYLLADNPTSGWLYWIADSCIELDFKDSVAKFCLRSMSDEYFGRRNLFQSDGELDIGGLPIRPVVELKAGVKIEKVDGTVTFKGQTYNNWQIR